PRTCSQVELGHLDELRHRDRQSHRSFLLAGPADDPFRCCRRIATAPRPAPHVNVGPAGTGVVAHNRLAPSLPGGAAVRRRGPLWPNGMSGLPSLRDDTTVPMVSPNIGLATAPRLWVADNPEERTSHQDQRVR